MNKLKIILLSILFSSCVGGRHPSNKTYEVEYEKIAVTKELCDFIFPNPESNLELLELRKEYKLDELIINTKSDIDKILILLEWTNSRWKHDGGNKPEKSDALYILKEAEKGVKFRCVEYSVVLSEVLNSIGIPTRIVGLKTRDVETTKTGAGHVVSEAYISDMHKWVFLDGQNNYIPFLNKIPLNAVEYKNAINDHKENVELINSEGTFNRKKTISNIDWVKKYLFYFDVSFDTSGKRSKCEGKRRLMLVPLNAKNPTLFQIKYNIDNCIYTNNINDFYKKPKIL